MVVTLGTGIGGGVVLDGHLLTGFTGAASELGHMCIVADGESCACGRRGCWETYASATALIRRTEAAMAAHPDSALHRIAREKGGVDGRTAFAGQEAGDPAATRVVAEYIRYLGVGIANLVNIFFPQVIALGGGIANQGETLLRPLRAQVQSQEYGSAYTKKHPRIVTCTLGSDARCHRRGPLCRGKAGIMPQASAPCRWADGENARKKASRSLPQSVRSGRFFWFLFK
ncbi:MAG: ROK family protein [Oscillospiraceae bacterium]